MKKLLTFVTALFLASSSYAQIGPIGSGIPFSWCDQGNYAVSDTTLGGTWSSSNTAVATIITAGGSNFAEILPNSPGTTTITYTVGAHSVTQLFTVLSPAHVTCTDTNFCVGHFYTFSDSSSGGVWSVYDSTLAHINALTGELTTIAPGIEVVNYSDSITGCTMTLQITYIHDTCLTTGETNIKPTNSFVTTYPNPASDELNIKWQETATENGNLMIYDITGREIYKTAINMTEGEGMLPIDMSAFNNGLYLISIISGNLIHNDKIQVIH